MLSNPFRKKPTAVGVLEIPQEARDHIAAFEPLPEPQPPPKPAPEPAPLVRPEPMAVEVVDHDALAEYVAVAESIGFSNPALARARLLNFLQREEIPVYDNERVAAFMSALTVELNKKRSRFDREMGNYKVWSWRPLVEQGDESGGWPADGMFSQRLYDRAVPLDALKTVATVKAQFPESKFYVTDYETVKPDPFLCVKLDGCEHVVIAVWDEPDFKLTKKA